MKKAVSLLLALSMVFILCACGQSEESKIVDGLIYEIGVVTLDSGESIEEAENAFNQLSEKDKKALKFSDQLMQARNDYDALVEKDAEISASLNEATDRLFLNFDPNGALTILDSLNLFTDEQKELADLLRENIELSYFEGTDFSKPEFFLMPDSSGQFTYKGQKGTLELTYYNVDSDTKCYIYHIVMDDLLSSNPILDYLSHLHRFPFLNIKGEYPEHWTPWAYSEGKLVYPDNSDSSGTSSNPTIKDSKGNFLSYHHHGTVSLDFDDNWYLEITIRQTDNT